MFIISAKNKSSCKYSCIFCRPIVAHFSLHALQLVASIINHILCMPGGHAFSRKTQSCYPSLPEIPDKYRHICLNKL